MKKLYLIPALAALVLLTACERERDRGVTEETGTTNGLQPGEVSPPPESPGLQRDDTGMRDDATMREQERRDLDTGTGTGTGTDTGVGTQQGVQPQDQNDALSTPPNVE